MAATDTITKLDVTKRRGTYRVVTRNTNYYVRCDRRANGWVACTSDGKIIRHLTDGIIGAEMPGLALTIEVGDQIILGRNWHISLQSSTVQSIKQIEDEFIDRHTCTRCKRFRNPGEPCPACRLVEPDADGCIANGWVDPYPHSDLEQPCTGPCCEPGAYPQPITWPCQQGCGARLHQPGECINCTKPR